MIITDIKVNKNINTYKIYIDNKYCISLEDIDLYNFNLKIGKQITKEELDELAKVSCEKRCFNKAIKLLSIKHRTSEELKFKLRNHEFSEETINKTIEKLVEMDYINDEKYIRIYIESCLNNRPMGKIRIKYDLLKRGLNEGLIDKVLTQCELNEFKNAVKLVRKKIACNYDIMDFKDNIKIKKFLQRRGFSIETINRAVKAVMEEMR